MAKLIIKNRYGVVPNSLLNDSRISLKAKGLFAYLQSKPKDWQFSVEKIASQTKEGKDAIRRTLQELEGFGYLTRKLAYDDEEKKISGYNYILNAKPILLKTNPTENQSTGFSEDISKKDIVRKNNILLNNKLLSNTGKASVSPKRKTPKKEIDEIIEYLKSTLSLDELDGTRKQNRQYANLLLHKFKSVALIKKVIQIAALDKFHRANLTSTRYLYYNAVKIVRAYRARKQKEKSNDQEFWEKKAQEFKQKLDETSK